MGGFRSKKNHMVEEDRGRNNWERQLGVGEASKEQPKNLVQ